MVYRLIYCLSPALVICFLATVLNIAALVLLHRRVIEWPSTRIFLLSLGYADLIVAVTNFISIFIFNVLELTHDPVHTSINLTIILFAINSGLVSVWLITLDRLICVVRPVGYRALAVPSVAKKITLAAWITGCFGTVGLIASYVALESAHVIRYTLAVLLAITCIYLIVAYTIIVRSVHATNQVLRERGKEEPLTAVERLKHNVRHKKENELACMSISIVVAFVVCTVPYIMFVFIYGNYRNFTCSGPGLFHVVAVTFLCLNLALDPCVYLFYRLALLTCWGSRQREEENDKGQEQQEKSASSCSGAKLESCQLHLNNSSH